MADTAVSYYNYPCYRRSQCDSHTLVRHIFAILIAVSSGASDIIPLLGFMGEGIDSMGNLIIITLLTGGMLGIIKATGGITFLLQTISGFVKGPRGGQAAIAMLVGTVNLCTANNTLAILTVGSLSREISKKYDISLKE